MADYPISKEAVVRELINLRDALGGPFAKEIMNMALAKLEGFQRMDAVPVVHARWEWYEDWGPSTWLEQPDLDKAGWKCSNCGIDLGDYLTDCLGVNVYVDEEDKMPKIKSCPCCDAKMNGGAEG